MSRQIDFLQFMELPENAFWKRVYYDVLKSDSDRRAIEQDYIAWIHKEPPELSLEGLPKIGDYRVTVGNVGTVYLGHHLQEAVDMYQAYVDQSINIYGRSAGEPVTMFLGGDLVREHTPPEEKE